VRPVVGVLVALAGSAVVIAAGARAHSVLAAPDVPILAQAPTAALESFSVVFSRDDSRAARVYGPLLRIEFRPAREGGFALYITHTRGTELLAMSRGSGWEIVLAAEPLRGLWDLAVVPYRQPAVAVIR
jgi:hypothetical protein